MQLLLHLRVEEADTVNRKLLVIGENEKEGEIGGSRWGKEDGRALGRTDGVGHVRGRGRVERESERERESQRGEREKKRNFLFLPNKTCTRLKV